MVAREFTRPGVVALLEDFQQNVVMSQLSLEADGELDGEPRLEFDFEP